MKKTVFKIVALLITTIISTSSTHAFYKTITLINRTGGPLSLKVLDKPLKRSDVPHLTFYKLDHYEEMTLSANNRVIGWFQPGEPTDYTILSYDDDAIVFIKHEGVIKTLHGQLRQFTLENPYDFSIIARTKNPHTGAIDCKDCLTSCRSANYCPCLDGCHDRTEDMVWHLDPYEQRHVQVASGTKIGLYDTNDREVIIKRTVRYEF